MPSNRPKWTDEHRSEARRRAYELAATLPAQKARTIALDAEWGAAGEQHYRRILREAGLDTGRIEREVRRLRALGIPYDVTPGVPSFAAAPTPITCRVMPAPSPRKARPCLH